MANKKEYVDHTITIEGAKLKFRNFSGKEAQYNPPGNRNFCVILDNDTAATLAAEGWNVKKTKPRDLDDEPENYIQVTVSFGKIRPKIVLISGSQKTLITEDDVNALDWADLKNVDLIINPYNWEVNGKHGVKAYLKTMYVTIERDPFEDKYQYDDAPDSAFSSLPFE